MEVILTSASTQELTPTDGHSQTWQPRQLESTSTSDSFPRATLSNTKRPSKEDEPTEPPLDALHTPFRDQLNPSGDPKAQKHDSDEPTKKETDAHHAYVKWSWVAFFLVLFTLFVFEGVCLHFTRLQSSRSHLIVEDLVEVGDRLDYHSAFLAIHPEATAAEKLSNVKLLLRAVSDYAQIAKAATESGRSMFYVQLVPIIFQGVLFVSVCVGLFILRERRVVKSRGREFTVQLAISGFCAQLFAALYTAAQCLVTVDLPLTATLGNEHALRQARSSFLWQLWVYISLMFTSTIVLYGGVVQRQRVIREIFDRKKVTMCRDLNFFSYMWVHGVAAAIVSGTMAWWAFAMSFDFNFPGPFIALNVMWMVILTYCAAWVWLIKTTQGSLVVFNDNSYNARTVTWILLMLSAIILFDHIDPRNILLGPMWSAAIRLASSVMVIDMVCGLYIIHRYSIGVKPKKAVKGGQIPSSSA